MKTKKIKKVNEEDDDLFGTPANKKKGEKKEKKKQYDLTGEISDWNNSLIYNLHILWFKPLSLTRDLPLRLGCFKTIYARFNCTQGSSLCLWRCLDSVHKIDVSGGDLDERAI